MSGSQQRSTKRQRELKRLKRREDKAERKKQRAANSSGGDLESMMAYVDENGRLTSVPQPLIREPKKGEEEEGKKDPAT